MRVAGVLFMVVSLCLAACASQSRGLTYAEVQTLNPGVSASWVLTEFPSANVTRWPDGTPKTATYQVTDPAGRRQSLQLLFDQRGILTSKCYSGPVVRTPPPKSAQTPQQSCR